jgi:hypothetical protein
MKTREVPNAIIAVVAVDATAKLFAVNPVRDLRENRLFASHSASLALPVLPNEVKIDHIVFYCANRLYANLSNNLHLS